MCGLRFVMDPYSSSRASSGGVAAENAQLAKAALSRQQLSSFPESEFSGQEDKVNIIDVSRNSLSSIPKSISIFTNMIELDISNNRISEIPDEIRAEAPTVP